MSNLTRRQAVASMAATFLAGALPRNASAQDHSLELGPSQSFSFDWLAQRAKDRATQPWKALTSPLSETLAKINYDAYQKIVWRKDVSLWAGDAGRPPVQLFHLGEFFREPARIFACDGSQAREILYRRSYFDMPADHIARTLPEDVGYAGFRIMNRKQTSDWLAFLGAAYFRSAGEQDQYGLSARAIAIDTAMPTPEEFPRFTEFYMEPVEDDADHIVINALMEGPSVTGALRFDCARRKGVVMDVQAVFHARKDIARFGVAPLTSMFWFGQIERSQAVDWRPRIHDSEGLAVWTGAGEHIWRPLANPPRVMTSSFSDRAPRGFGLLQRHRDFADFQDDGVFYEKRPSLWVETLGDWGPGAVQLVEIPTDDEIHDNIAAYWVSDTPVKAGDTREFRYRLHWVRDEPFRPMLATVLDTFAGSGGVPGQPRPKGVRRFVIDVEGKGLSGRKRGEFVVDVRASRGTFRGEPVSYPVVGQDGVWRCIFDVEAPAAVDPVDLRMVLRDKAGAPVSETWTYQYFPPSRGS